MDVAAGRGIGRVKVVVDQHAGKQRHTRQPMDKTDLLQKYSDIQIQNVYCVNQSTIIVLSASAVAASALDFSNSRLR